MTVYESAEFWDWTSRWGSVRLYSAVRGTLRGANALATLRTGRLGCGGAERLQPATQTSPRAANARPTPADVQRGVTRWVDLMAVACRSVSEWAP